MDRYGDVFRATFEVAPIGIAHVGADGAFLRVNPRLCEIVGFDADALVALRFQDITHPDDLDADLDLLRETAEGVREGYEMEKRYVRADGVVIWVMLTVSVVRNPDGSPRMYVSIIDDIDVEKRTQDSLTEALRRLESHFRHTPLAVVEWDGDFRVRRWAGAAERLFGYPESEVLGKRPDEIGFVHEADAEAVGEIMAGLLDGSVDASVSENRNRRRDGRIVVGVWHNSVIPLPDGGVSILSLVQDVTEERAAQEAERRLRRELEDRVEARTEELAETVAALERSNADLERFAYIASHDLQEPLRMVSSYTQLLAERYRGQLDERADRFTHYAVDGAERMRHLILDLLEYSRIGRGEIALQPVPVDRCLDRALEVLRVAIDEADAVIERGPLPTVLAVDGMVVQVLLNLIGNALKFVAPGGSPWVRVDARAHEDFWEISVTDDGIGIDPDHARRIFEPFQRLHARSDYAGTGIGLSICQRAVERLGGHIRAEPAGASGTAFRFTLPAVPDAADTAGASP
jgi:PAS domain S-box-containing protein